MKKIMSTKDLELIKATEHDVLKIMALEQDPANKAFIWQGTYDEHLHEINADDFLLLMVKRKTDQVLVGYVLNHLNKASEIFELRRIAIEEKGKGYGRQVIQALMGYCFETLKMNRFWLDVYPHNVVGLHLYKSLGLVYEGTLRENYKSEGSYLDQEVYAMLKSEYFSLTK